MLDIKYLFDKSGQQFLSNTVLTTNFWLLRGFFYPRCILLSVILKWNCHFLLIYAIGVKVYKWKFLNEEKWKKRMVTNIHWLLILIPIKLANIRITKLTFLFEYPRKPVIIKHIALVLFFLYFFWCKEWVGPIKKLISIVSRTYMYMIISLTVCPTSTMYIIWIILLS